MAVAKGTLFDVEFFELQIRFAKRVAELTGVSLAQAVGTHTNIYVRLGMGPQFDASNAAWQAYLAELVAVHDKVGWTHAVHARRLHLSAGPTPTDAVGCFSYVRIAHDRARLHFHAGEPGVESPLSVENRSARRRELTALLSTLKGSSSESMRIVGASWLYNLPSYRCLFPEAYLASLRPMVHPYQRMPLWGQLLTRDRRVRPDARARFLEGIARAGGLAELDLCFPFQVLTTTAPVEWFFGHVGRNG